MTAFVVESQLGSHESASTQNDFQKLATVVQVSGPGGFTSQGGKGGTDAWIGGGGSEEQCERCGSFQLAKVCRGDGGRGDGRKGGGLAEGRTGSRAARSD